MLTNNGNPDNVASFIEAKTSRADHFSKIQIITVWSLMDIIRFYAFWCDVPLGALLRKELTLALCCTHLALCTKRETFDRKEYYHIISTLSVLDFTHSLSALLLFYIGEKFCMMYVPVEHVLTPSRFHNLHLFVSQKNHSLSLQTRRKRKLHEQWVWRLRMKLHMRQRHCHQPITNILVWKQ